MSARSRTLGAWAAVLAVALLLARLCLGGAEPLGAKAPPPARIEAEPRAGAPEVHAAAPKALAPHAPERTPAREPNHADPRLASRIESRIQAALASARALAPGPMSQGAARIAVHVRELGVPGELVAVSASRAMRPASNQKLVTSAAALVLLGPAWSFETRFEAGGEVAGGVLRGPLVVRAGADPCFDPAGSGEFGGLARIASSLAAQGIQVVEGGIVLDEGTFQDPGPGPAWPSADQHGLEYCALSGGFSANAGCLTMVVRATRAGRPAEVEIHPRHHGLRREVDVATVPAKRKLVVHVEARGERAKVSGSIPSDVPEWSARCASPDPVELFGAVLRGALEDAGIDVRGEVVRTRGARGGRELARLRTPLLDALVPINTDSNNAVADQVFLAMGAAVAGEGTRAGGAAAVSRALERLGVPTEGLAVVDGSGLSRDNRVSARQITALLDAVLRLDPATAAAFRNSLAVAGETGTLHDRMSGGAARGRVHAKTGFIEGTSALSGVLRGPSGRELVFAILVDYPAAPGLNSQCWKRLQDEICEILVAEG